MVLLLSSCSPTKTLKSQTRIDLLDTVITISSYEDIPDEVFELIHELELKLSIHHVNSEISAINRMSGVESIIVSPVTYDLISKAIEISKCSNGAFNPAMGALSNLWKIGTENARKPADSEIGTALELIDFNDIELREGNSVFLRKSGMAIDLGAIAKGYICDAVANYLVNQGIERVVLDFGGDVYLIGQKNNVSDWIVGVQSPIIGEDSYIFTLSASNISVVTSGNYERFFEQDGEIFHHILDPNTGYPVDNNLVSVTIISENTTEADAIATACFVLGVDDGLKLIAQLPGIEGIFVTNNREIYASPETRVKIQLSDNSFVLK